MALSGRLTWLLGSYANGHDLIRLCSVGDVCPLIGQKVLVGLAKTLFVFVRPVLEILVLPHQGLRQWQTLMRLLISRMSY